MQRQFLFVSLAFTIAMTLLTIACSPLEQQAYKTVVASRAFLQSEYSKHPECTANSPTGTASHVCVLLSQAVAAKDALIDSVEVYCSGTKFDDIKSNAPCEPPSKTSPAYDQAVNKLKAALSNYAQIERDIKQAAGK